MKSATLHEDSAFRAAVARLLHWTLLIPYIDQPDLEQLIVKVHGTSGDSARVGSWNGGVGSIGEELRQAFGRYQRELLDLWRRGQDSSTSPHEQESVQLQLARLASHAFQSEVEKARSLQHPAVGWLYALERRNEAREFSWKAQAEAFSASGGKVGAQQKELTEEALRRADENDLYPEKQHIVPFSIARQIVDKGGTRATASRANDIGNLTWLSHRQNGLEALCDRWTAMDRAQDTNNLAARGMFARADFEGTDSEVLGLYETLQNMALNKNPWNGKADELFAALCKGRRDWMVEQMRAWLEEPLSAEALAWLGDEAQ